MKSLPMLFVMLPVYGGILILASQIEKLKEEVQHHHVQLGILIDAPQPQFDAVWESVEEPAIVSHNHLYIVKEGGQ